MMLAWRFWSGNSAMFARYSGVFRSVVALIMLLLFLPYGLSDYRVACTIYREMGDVNLGALLSLHGSASSHCDTDIIPRGVVHAEAMAWAVRDINSRNDILPGVTLGFDIRDDCRNEDISLWMSLLMLENISPDAFKDSCPGTTVSSTNLTDTLHDDLSHTIIGIIGTSRSATSIPVAQITALFQVPLMSFWASSNELSDKARFPYFLRTVPPDQHQIIAIVDMLQYFQWEYIAVIHSVDSYGLHGARELLVLTEQRGICVAFTSAVNQYPTEKELSEVVAKLVRYKYAHVVVMFSALQVANAVLGQVAKMEPGLKRTWIGGDDWGFDLTEHGFTDIAQGSLFTRFYSQTVPNFEAHLAGLDPATDTVSSWFTDYRNARRSELGCGENTTECPGVFPDNPSNDFVVSPVIDGVYAFAHALDSLLKQCPGGLNNCTDVNTITGHGLMPHLRNVNFAGTGGLLYFDENADPPGKYIMKNYKRLEDGSYASVEIGVWNSLNAGKRLQLQVDEIRWQDGSTEAPRSTCIPDCVEGFILVPSEDKCCWTCQECSNNEIVINRTVELTTKACLACDIASWPSHNRSVCEDIIPTTLSFQDPVVITILLFTLIGLILTGLTVAGFMVYRDRALIKAASRELSSIILVGVIVAIVGVVLLLLPPTRWTCLVSEAAISLSFTLTYAPTLLKVNRIYRIFRASKKSVRRPKWVSPRNLLFVAGVLILVQIIVIAISSSVRPVKALSTVPAVPTNYLELYCAFGYEFLVPCTYNLALIVACCFYAFKTRQVPDNYNESKFIAVSVYSTLVVCLAALPVYFTAVAVLQKVATLCSALLLNVYLTLVCLYLPKLYAVRFLPKEQTNQTLNVIRGGTISSKVDGSGGSGSVVGQIRPL
ncbi:metabotropic glutamate receptor-like [Asterias amurensis]|uniref:metabotropic glutamate receptor-like n=1 Tax=Asterias amurensis TaxID=7602 RepID=UPI003AB5A4AF